MTGTNSFARCLLVAASLWIVHLTFVPMRLEPSFAILPTKLQEALHAPISGRLGEHAVVYGVFGFLLGLATCIRLRVLVPGVGLVLIVLEVAQLGFVGRHARPADLVANSLAVFLCLVAGRRFSAPVLVWLQAHTRRLAAGLVVVAALGMVAVRIVVYQPYDLRSWDPSYTLLIGDELGGGRAWRGRFVAGALFPSVLSAEQARLLAETDATGERGVELRKRLGTVATYVPARATGARVGDVSGVGVAPELVDTGGRNRVVSGAWRFDATGALEAEGSSARLCAALTLSPGFSVEVDVAPEDLELTGPSRIFTLSVGYYRRNFTVGQEADSFVFRVRSEASDENGYRNEARWPRAFEPRKRVHLLATYEQGEMLLYRDGQPWGEVWSTRRRAEAKPGVGGWSVLVALMWLLPVGWALALAWPNARAPSRWAVGAAVWLVPSVVVGLRLGSVTARFVEPQFLAWGVIALVAGDRLGRSQRLHPSVSAS